MLFILDRLGDACRAGDDAPESAVRVIQSERKLQKLDFLIRNPDYLANVIISGCEEGRLPPQRLLDARAVLEEREPELHTYRMLRGRHGAFEQLNNALSVLRPKYGVVTTTCWKPGQLERRNCVPRSRFWPGTTSKPRM
jgi:hypothetical protein